MIQVDNIIKICQEVLDGETFLEDSVIQEILSNAMELKSKISQ